MPYSIRITYDTPVQQMIGGIGVFRLRVTASEAEGVPPEVFLLKRVLANSVGPTYKEEFITVCTPRHIANHPANTPDPANGYVRRSTFDLYISTPDLVAKSVSEIDRRVKLLLLTTESLADFSETNSKTISTEP